MTWLERFYRSLTRRNSTGEPIDSDLVMVRSLAAPMDEHAPLLPEPDLSVDRSPPSPPRPVIWPNWLEIRLARPATFGLPPQEVRLRYTIQNAGPAALKVLLAVPLPPEAANIVAEEDALTVAPNPPQPLLDIFDQPSQGGRGGRPLVVRLEGERADVILPELKPGASLTLSLAYHLSIGWPAATLALSLPLTASLAIEPQGTYSRRQSLQAPPLPLTVHLSGHTPLANIRCSSHAFTAEPIAMETRLTILDFTPAHDQPLELAIVDEGRPLVLRRPFDLFILALARRIKASGRIDAPLLTLAGLSALGLPADLAASLDKERSAGTAEEVVVLILLYTLTHLVPLNLLDDAVGRAIRGTYNALKRWADWPAGVEERLFLNLRAAIVWFIKA